METTIQQAAECLRRGSHRDADIYMRELQHHLQLCPLEALQQLMAYLQSSAGNMDKAAITTTTTYPIASINAKNDVSSKNSLSFTYEHFVTLKLIKLCIIHGRTQWRPYTSEILNTLFTYALTMNEFFVQHAWRPVTSELCTCIAIILKLQCIVEPATTITTTTNSSNSCYNKENENESALINVESLRDSMQQLMSLLVSIANNEPHLTAGQLVLYRGLVQSYVEECGLYTQASQARGIPLRLHRHLRRVCESCGVVPSLARMIFNGFSVSACESTFTLECGLRTFITCLSWYSHRFFEEDNSSADNTVEVFVIGDSNLINTNSVNINNDNISNNSISNNNNSSNLGIDSYNSWNELLLERHTILSSSANNNNNSGSNSNEDKKMLCEVVTMWIMTNRIKSNTFTQRQVLVEIMQLLSSFKSERWQRETQMQFVQFTLSSCLNLLKWLPREQSASISSLSSMEQELENLSEISLVQLQQWLEQERQGHEPQQKSNSCIHWLASNCTISLTLENAEYLSMLANSILRLVQNYTEILISHNELSPLLALIAECTRDVLVWDTLMELHMSSSFSVVDVDEEVIKDSTMASLHDLLRVWYTFALSLERCRSAANVLQLQSHCAFVVNTYLHHKAFVFTDRNLEQLILRICKENSYNNHNDNNNNNRITGNEHEDTFSESFSLSHLHLIAHVARCAAAECCFALTSHLNQLQTTLSQLQQYYDGKERFQTNRSVASVMEHSIYEPLWVCFKLIATFIADADDEERVHTPRCFIELASSLSSDVSHNNTPNSNALVDLMLAVLSWHSILQQGVIDSPAVWVGYTEVLHSYLRTYVEMEEDAIPAYSQAFNGGAVIVSCALEAASLMLKQFPYEEDTTTAISKLLDVLSDKSVAIRRYVTSHEQIATLYQLAFDMERFRFFRRTRGSLIGFLLSCTIGCDNTMNNKNNNNSDSNNNKNNHFIAGMEFYKEVEQGQQLTFELVFNSLIHITEQLQMYNYTNINNNNNNNNNNNSNTINDNNVAVTDEFVMEILYTLVGILKFVQRQQQLVSAMFTFYNSTTRKLLSICNVRFYAKEMATEMVSLVAMMFTTCSVMLESSATQRLLELTITGLEFVTSTCVQVQSWRNVAGPEDEATVQFCTAVSLLLASIAQWKVLDCFLPEDEIAPLSFATVHTMASMLKHLDASMLRFPELEERVFSAFVSCVESFTPICVAYHESQVFFMGVVYALNSSSASIQRSGLSVISAFVSCAAQPHNEHNQQAHQVCVELLKVNLNALVQNKVAFANVHLLARSLLMIARFVSTAELASAFEAIAHDRHNGTELLEKLFSELTAVITVAHFPLPSSSTASTKSSSSFSSIASSPQQSNTISDEFENTLQDLLASHRGATML